MDRYINDALQDFAEWYVASDWLGKERDCVNIFALQYLKKGIAKNAAISDLSQIRIECAVTQPPDKEQFTRPSAAKDLVIWQNPLDTAWDADWKPGNIPRAIIEWKTSRTGRASDQFDAHDVAWLKAFTETHPKTFGFLVSTHASKTHRRCAWALVRGGSVKKAKIVEIPKSA